MRAWIFGIARDLADTCARIVMGTHREVFTDVYGEESTPIVGTTGRKP